MLQAEYDDAIADLTEAIRLEVELGRSYYNRGVAYFRRGSVAKGIQDFQQVFEVSNDEVLIASATQVLNSFGTYP